MESFDNIRLDIYISKKFNKSREFSKELIENEKVFVNGMVISKPSYKIFGDESISILEDEFTFVSRGGKKLLGAIKNFNLDIKNKTCLDIGASTGGFTDCLLQHGASKVFAVDVGSSQLSEKIKNDKRVISIENKNIKDLTKNDITEKIDIIVMDLSFISLTKIMDVTATFTDGFIVCLIKPQFEVGKQFIKNGIVKDKKLHKKVLKELYNYFTSIGINILDSMPSPIKGQNGNLEFLTLLGKNGTSIDVENFIKKSFTEYRL